MAVFVLLCFDPFRVINISGRALCQVADVNYISAQKKRWNLSSVLFGSF